MSLPTPRGTGFWRITSSNSTYFVTTAKGTGPTPLNLQFY
jgi:hypothetical protein